MAVRTYDPKQVIVLLNGIPIGGWADGTFLSVERSGDSYSKVSGADGIVSRSKSNDRSGAATLTLAQTSPSNDVLQALAIADELTNTGVVPFLVQDLSGRSTFVSAYAWIRKPANAEFGKEVANREWSLDLADLDMKNGGNADVA